MAAPDVIVIGGGIIGLAAARALSDAGSSVEVLERGRPGGEASYAAAGMLAPLAEVPDPGPFFDACSASRDLWRRYAPQLSEETGFDLDYDRSGALLIDPEPAVLDRYADAAKRLAEPTSQVGKHELRRLIPDLDPAIEAGLLLAGEHRVDNRAVCRALERGLEQRRVPVIGGCRVLAVKARKADVLVSCDGTSRTADRVLIAAGAWSGEIAGPAGAPTRPVRGQMMAYSGVSWPFSGCVRTADRYAVRRAGGGLLIGATVEEAGFDDRTTSEGRERLVSIARRLFPSLAGHPPVTFWSGLRPGSPDGLPLIGPLDPSGRLWIASGHYRNGILLAPWTAAHLADAMAGELSALAALGPFSPSRDTAASTLAGA